MQRQKSWPSLSNMYTCVVFFFGGGLWWLTVQCEPVLCVEDRTMTYKGFAFVSCDLVEELSRWHSTTSSYVYAYILCSQLATMNYSSLQK